MAPREILGTEHTSWLGRATRDEAELVPMSPAAVRPLRHPLRLARVREFGPSLSHAALPLSADPGASIGRLALHAGHLFAEEPVLLQDLRVIALETCDPSRVLRCDDGHCAIAWPSPQR